MNVISQTISRMSGKKRGRISSKWELSASSDISSGPICLLAQEPLIIIGTKKGELCAYDLEGKKKWDYRAQGKLSDTERMFLENEEADTIVSNPAAGELVLRSGQHIAFGTELGELILLDSSGKFIWKYVVKASVKAEPLIVDINGDGNAEIIFGSTDKFVYALNSKGKLLWRFQADSEIESGFSVFKGKKCFQIVFGTNNGTLYSITNDGDKLWEFKTKGKITSTPLIAHLSDDTVYNIIFGSYDGCLYVLDEKGYIVWSYQTNGRLSSPACVKDINNDGKLEVIFGSCDNNLYVLNNEGSKLWSYETDFWIVAAPIVADIDEDSKDEIVVGSFDNCVYILDGEASFSLDYIPGVSAVASQRGNSGGYLSNQPGSYIGKRLWQYKTDGMVVGMTLAPENKGKGIIVATNRGKIINLVHQNE